MKNLSLTVIALLMSVASFAIGVISGPSSLCTGTTITLTDTPTGGTWSSSDVAVAAVGSSSGIVIGISAGVVTITYTVGASTATATLTVYPMPASITGSTSVCTGSSSALADATPGGIWSSSTTGVATIGATTGTVSGMSVGVTGITYMLPTGCSATTTITVNPSPAAISGPSSVCEGSAITLSDATTGGTWSSGSTSVATVGTGGTVTGVTAGSTTIAYTLGSGCSFTQTITVNTSPTPVTGFVTLCEGTSTTLFDGTSGGTWSSANPAVASIGSTSGVVLGVAAGSATISYTLPSGCYTAYGPMTIFARPTAIIGPVSVCVGNTIGLSDGTFGGTWISSNPSIATVGYTSGIVTGVSVGATMITYMMTSGCFVTATVTVGPAVGAITGSRSECIGSSATLSSSTSGGIWASSSTTIAVIGSTTGTYFGLSAGTATITYSFGSACYALVTVTVNPLPATITGASTVCVGACTTETDATSGGTWSSANTAIASIGSVSGTTCGVSLGSTNITYTSAAGCITTKTITASAAPAGITGSGNMCLGSCVTLSDATTGGTWSTGSSVVTVGSATGIVCGISTGIATITYSLGTGCNATKTVTVSPAPAAISGPSAVCLGSSISLTDAASGGTWSSSSTSVATVDASGNVVGVALGSATITYTLSGGCYATKSITVNAIPAVHAVSGGGSYCAGGLGVDIMLTASETGISYQLYNSSSAVGSAIFGTGSVIDFGLIVPAGTYTVMGTNAVTGCAVAMAGSATIFINPLPAAYAVSGTGSYCAGSAGSDITMVFSEAGMIYTLYNGGTSVATLSGTGSMLDFGFYTAGSYSITATSATTGCTAAMSGTAIVTANPLPTRYAVTGGGSFCSGSAGVHIALANSQAGTNYQVRIGGFTSSPVAGTSAAIDLGTFTATGIAIVTAVNTATGCTDTMSGTVTLDTIAAPAPISGTTNVCSGGSTTLTDAISGGTWSSSSTAVATIGAGTGTVAGISAGTTIITYTIGTACIRTATVTVNPIPVTYTVTGGGSFCSGGTGVAVGLSGSVIGINYQLYHGGSPIGSPIAGTGSPLSFGLQTASGAYTAIATNTITSCTGNMAGSATVGITAAPVSYSVTGGGSFCAGGSGVHVGLAGSATGVNYQLFIDGIALGSAVPGTGSSLGWGPLTTAGLYTVIATTAATSCNATMTGSATITITSLVTPSVSVSSASGDTVCSGTSAIFSAIPVNGGASPAYAWSVNGTVAATGATYTYIPVNGDIVSVFMTSSVPCVTTSTANDSMGMTVITPGPIVGSMATCIGSVLTLSDTATGGTWSSSDASIATIATVGASTGVVSGITTGTAVMTYTMVAGCFVTTSVTVGVPPVISASSTAASCGELYTLTATGGTSYVWAPASGLSCNTCSTTSADPSATTTYTVTGTNASGCSDVATVTINGNRILGHISFSGTPPDTLDMKVWLIQFNASDSSLAAMDSFYTCLSSGTPYYEFDSRSPGNYMVKAQLLHGNPVGSSGYIPTYGYSSPHWDSATTVTHASGTDSVHIHMLRGTVPPGPGFIGGLISAGAGRGVSAEAPVAGMLVYLKDAAGIVLAYTYTDVNGRYSFADIAYGTYIIYPEAYNFHTTPSSAITVSVSNLSVNDINFRQSLTYNTIKPYTTAIKTIVSGTGLNIFPNPATGYINIEWKNQQAEQAIITLTDITGRDVYNTRLNISSASGNAQLDVSGISAGNYLLRIKSDHIFYTGKLIIE